MSDSLQPHEPQHARPPCPSPTTLIYNHFILTWFSLKRHYFNIMSHSQVLSRQKISQDIIQLNISGIVIGNASAPPPFKSLWLTLVPLARTWAWGMDIFPTSVKCFWTNMLVPSMIDHQNQHRRVMPFYKASQAILLIEKKERESKTSNVPWWLSIPM